MLWHASDQDLRDIHARMAEGFSNGPLSPVVGVELPLAEAGKAHEQIFQGGTLGKIVLLT